MNKFPMVAAAFVLSVAIARPGWAEPEVKLQPGVQIEFEVPGTPPSFADIRRNTGAQAVRMCIKLPADYSKDKSYPVLVFLSGGDGGGGGELNQAEPFLGGEGYILCNLPQFKREFAGTNEDQQWTITPLESGHAVPAFRLLLKRLRELVPNIDTARSVLAGFSNGANSAELIMRSGDTDLLSLFSSFVLIEGGFSLGDERTYVWPEARFAPAQLAALRGKRVLLMHGDKTNPPDRIPYIQSAQRAAEALRKAGVETALMPMKDTGHDFPAAEMTRARAWVLASRP
jgi:predicted esterase